jgi:pSer/pThr/pTyr-binding forkhead associated (FHA) protein
MKAVTFKVLEGVDKGRIFRELAVPVSIGREEGNTLRLNDERVSRYHAKIQVDDSDLILTDLGSTNGTRVNGQVVEIRRLRVGDRITLGRSVLLFGSDEEIIARMATMQNVPTARANVPLDPGLTTPQAQALALQQLEQGDFDIDPKAAVTVQKGELYLGTKPLPPLPQKMTPSQAARLAEILDLLHQNLNRATESIRADEDASQVLLTYADWQRILAVQMLLARYVRAVTEPDVLES